MTDRYENIRKALAMGPTPGPWEVLNGTDVFTQLGARNAAGVEAAANDGWHIADCDMGPSFTEEGEADIPYVEKRANAALITACDPDTIRELLAERDALAAEVERLAEALALLPDEIVMIEHNPDEGPLMFCCGRKVTLSWRHDLIPTHDEGCWYARMRALRDRDQEAAMREEGKA